MSLTQRQIFAALYDSITPDKHALRSLALVHLVSKVLCLYVWLEANRSNNLVS